MPTAISNLSSLTPQPPATPAGKIGTAAKDFESILLGQWLQAAETSFGSVPGGEDGQDDGDDQLKSFGVQQLARALSDSGGIGIAGMISKSLTHSESSPATVADHADNTVST